MAFLISGSASKVTYQEEICQKVNSFCVQPTREESIVTFGRLFKQLVLTVGPTPEHVTPALVKRASFKEK